MKNNRLAAQLTNNSEQTPIIPVNQENNDIAATPAPLAAHSEGWSSGEQNERLIEIWLGILTQRIPTACACVVMLDGSTNRFEWRQGNDTLGKKPNLESLRAAARLARRSERQVSTHDRHHLSIAGKLPAPDALSAFIGSFALAFDAPNSEQSNIQAEVEISLHWFSRLLGNFRDLGFTTNGAAPWIAMMFAGATLNERLQASVDQLAREGWAERVALGLARGEKISRLCVSGQRDYAKRSPLQHRLRTSMQDAAASWRREAVFTPQITEHGLTLQVPLVFQNRLVGILLLDRRGANKFSAEECERLAAEGQLLGALIDLAEAAERDPVTRTKRIFGAVLPGSGKTKIAAFVALTTVLAVAAFPTTTRITAESKIEGELQRALVAPMETYLDEVHVLAGQTVETGDLLATFATEDLSLERLKWQSERARKLKAKRDAAARQERAKLGVLDAEIAQANAEISLVESKIARRELRAPVDGVIVSGDLSQRLGSPVEKGEVLFEIVPGGSYQLAVLLDEQDSKTVEVGQLGHLKLNAFPDSTMPIEIVRVTPVNEITPSGNYFVAYAALKDATLSIKPGMRGVSKIDVGTRAAVLNWTESFRRWWSLKIWQWLGWA